MPALLACTLSINSESPEDLELKTSIQTSVASHTNTHEIDCHGSRARPLRTLPYEVQQRWLRASLPPWPSPVTITTVRKTSPTSTSIFRERINPCQNCPHLRHRPRTPSRPARALTCTSDISRNHRCLVGTLSPVFLRQRYRFAFVSPMRPIAS